MPLYEVEVDLAEVPLKRLRVEGGTTFPASPQAGRLYWRTDLLRLYCWTGGTTWALVTPLSYSEVPGLQTALSDKANGTVQLTAGTGLTGGGDLTTNRTFAVNFGTTSGTVAQGNDSRFTDTRAPSGSAGGDLTGTYPNPTVGTGAITAAKLNAAVKPTTAGGSAVPADFALRAIGTGTQDAVGNTDARLSDARTPTGAAGGDLANTYPSPTVGLGKIGYNKLANDVKPTVFSGGTAVVTDPALRALGLNAPGWAMPSDVALNQINVPNGPLSMNNKKIQGLADPTSDSDAANKFYVDNAVQGLDAKASVRAATNVNINNMGVLSGTGSLIFDGVQLVPGDRLLVKNQTSTSANGIYVVDGSGAPNYALVRAGDMDTWNEVPGAFVFVEEGTNYADTGWVSTANPGGSLGSTAISWTQFSSAGVVTASGVMVKTGNDISLNFNGSHFTGTSGILQIAPNAIDSVKLAVGSVDLASTVVTGTLSFLKGGTGATTQAGARANLGAISSIQLLCPTMVAGTWYTLTHNLSTTCVTTAFLDVTGGLPYTAVVLDWRVNSTATIQIKSDVAITANTVAINIQG